MSAAGAAVLMERTGDRGVVHPIRLTEKVAYGLGDFASNMIWTATLTYIVYFYTDIYLIPPAIVAVIMLVCRVANAVIDPVIGMVIDRRQDGQKARPFIKWGAGPLALVTFLVFLPLGHSTPVKVAWALTSFMMLSITYSLVNVAYGMLTNLMTGDSLGRLRLSSARFIGANIGAVLIGWITLKAVAWLGHGADRLGFPLFMGLVGLASAGCFAVTYSVCKERVLYGAPHDAGTRELLIALLRNRPWRLLTTIKFTGSVASTLAFGMATYQAIHVLKLGVGFGGTLVAMLTAGSFIGCWLAPFVAKRLGIRNTVILANLGQALGYVGLALLHVGPVAILADAAVIGLLMGVRDPVTYTMLGDTIDAGAAETGIGAVGLAYASATAAYKVAAGIGGALAAMMLGWSGYVAGAHSQTPAVLATINFGFATLPALLLALAALITLAYPSDQRMKAAKAGEPFVAQPG
jgi:sugar (glycoside-pentoside-hexuronide) transporter